MTKPFVELLKIAITVKNRKAEAFVIKGKEGGNFRMSIININAKEIHCKILYYGPTQSGKKSSLLYIKENLNREKRDFFSLSLEEKLYALILNIGNFVGFQTFFHIYNLNNHTKLSREKCLEGVDGLIFVASQELKARGANKKSILEIENFFKEKDQTLFNFPLVLQYNKSDLKERISLKTLKEDLNKYNNEDFQSSVLKGEKVFEPLKYLCKLILNDLKSVKT